MLTLEQLTIICRNCLICIFRNQLNSTVYCWKNSYRDQKGKQLAWNWHKFWITSLNKQWWNPLFTLEVDMIVRTRSWNCLGRYLSLIAWEIIIMELFGAHIKAFQQDLMDFVATVFVFYIWNYIWTVISQLRCIFLFDCLRQMEL